MDDGKHAAEGVVICGQLRFCKGFLCDFDHFASAHLSDLFARCVCPLALMKSANRIPITLPDYNVLTTPRGVPIAAAKLSSHSVT